MSDPECGARMTRMKRKMMMLMMMMNDDDVVNAGNEKPFKVPTSKSPKLMSDLACARNTSVSAIDQAIVR